MPLMGIRRPKVERPVEVKVSSSGAQRVIGRVKSYNTRKGLGA